MARERSTRRQKDISRLLKEQSRIRKDKLRRDKGRIKPGK